ncbi:hypothetical protein Tco_0308723 [Tanacetum coccineum]
MPAVLAPSPEPPVNDGQQLNNLGLDESGVSVNETLFRGMIGSLMYLTASRPDIQFSTCLCARLISGQLANLNLADLYDGLDFEMHLQFVFVGNAFWPNILQVKVSSDMSPKKGYNVMNSPGPSTNPKEIQIEEGLTIVEGDGDMNKLYDIAEKYSLINLYIAHLPKNLAEYYCKNMTLDASDKEVKSKLKSHEKRKLDACFMSHHELIEWEQQEAY